MAKLYVYDSYENRMLVYNNLNENDPMPYSYGSTLSVREFRGSSNARVLWTTTRVCFQIFRSISVQPCMEL